MKYFYYFNSSDCSISLFMYQIKCKHRFLDNLNIQHFYLLQLKKNKQKLNFLLQENVKKNAENFMSANDIWLEVWSYYLGWCWWRTTRTSLKKWKSWHFLFSTLSHTSISICLVPICLQSPAWQKTNFPHTFFIISLNVSYASHSSLKETSTLWWYP